MLQYRGEENTEESRIDRLRKIGFFSELSDFDLHQIEGITTERRYEPDELIVQESSAAESFFIICHGKIEITKKFEDGEDFILGVHSDGEFFGEMALLDEGPRSASARALEPTLVLEIPRADFESLIYTAPVLAYTIMKELSSRLRQTGALLIAHLQQKNRRLRQSHQEGLIASAGAVFTALTAEQAEGGRLSRMEAWRLIQEKAGRDLDPRVLEELRRLAAGRE